MTPEQITAFQASERASLINQATNICEVANEIYRRCITFDPKGALDAARNISTDAQQNASTIARLAEDLLVGGADIQVRVAAMCVTELVVSDIDPAVFAEGYAEPA